MRTVCRNSFARQTIRAERAYQPDPAVMAGCAECGYVRRTAKGSGWPYRFHVDDDSGSRHSGPILDGRLFCSRECAESYGGIRFDETAGRGAR